MAADDVAHPLFPHRPAPVLVMPYAVHVEQLPDAKRQGVFGDLGVHAPSYQSVEPLLALMSATVNGHRYFL